MSHPSPTVFVVDDDLSVRESLEALLQTVGWNVRCFASAQDFLSSEPALGPSCLLLDVTLPDFNGLDLQELVARDRLEMPIIFITGYGDVPMSVRAMKAGALEFLTKPLDDGVLIEAVANAVERSRGLVQSSAELRTLRERYDLLTRRERDVMTLVVSGLLNKQVGFELGISEITVKAHRGRAMEKMAARSFADLVMMSAKLEIPKSVSGN
jgi:FixJ family two-component response regulator